MVGGSFISKFIDWRAMGNNTMSKFTMTLCRSTLWHCGPKYNGFLVCRTPIMISGQVSETSLDSVSCPGRLLGGKHDRFWGNMIQNVQCTVDYVYIYIYIYIYLNYRRKFRSQTSDNMDR